MKFGPRSLALAAASLLGACAQLDSRREVGAAAAALCEAPAFAGARVGVLVVDTADGATWCESAADQGFATASNMKLLTAAVALQSLGPDHRATTRVVARGPREGDVLRGDLVLIGQGDPTLGEDGGAVFADRLAAALQAAGIRRIAGRIVGDDRWLGTEHLGLGWQWDYLDEDYAAPFGGLCFHRNLVELHVRPGPVAVVTVTPGVPLPPTVAVRVVDAGQPTELSARRPLGSETIVVRGQIAADAKAQTLAVTVADPAAFAAQVVTRLLQQRGIEIAEAALALATGPELAILDEPSPPLAAIVAPMLTRSDNLYAEVLWRLAARQAGGDGSTAAAERHAKAVLTGLGVDPAGMVLADGSGLSRRNLVRPRQVVALLAAMWRSPHRAAFVEGLPVAGQSGTLRSRFRDGAANGRVRAKTGYISRVVCLSGYVPRPDPAAAPLAFCVMVNDFTGDDATSKRLVDAFVERLAVAAGW